VPRILALVRISFLLLSITGLAQNTISTIAGGGSPLNGISPTNAMVGIATSVVEDAKLNMYVTASGEGYVFKIAPLASPTISILAGTGYGGISSSGIPATTATLEAPTGLALDAGGANLFVSEIYSNHVFEVNLASGTLTNFAGNTSASNPVGGYSGDGGPATQAALNTPQGIAFARVGPNAGTLYIADQGNNVIRAVAPGGTITTFAGNGTPCAAPPTCGDGQAATKATLTSPFGVTVDGSGNVFIADTGDNEIREVDTTGTITLFAGTGAPCNTAPTCGDGGPPTSAALNNPVGVFASGTSVYVADQFDQVVRQVINGVIFSVAGTYLQGFSGDNGVAVSAQLSNPAGVFVDGAGNILIADQGNNRVREITPGPAPTINTIIGGGTGGDGGPPLQAAFSAVFDVALDASNNLYVVDNGTSRIREVSGGVVNTIAGDGAADPNALNYPKGVVVAATGTPPGVFIADTSNQVVRLRTEALFTFAGTPGQPCSAPPNCGDGLPANSAELTVPQGVALDANGNLFIADSGDNEIREVDSTSGIISRIAGNGTPCAASTNACGDGGPATSANLNFPIGVAVDSAGNIYIADTFDNRIRKVDVTTQNISTVAFNGNSSFAGGTGGPALSASMALPNKVVVDNKGNLFIGGGLDEVVQRVDAATQTISTVAGVSQNPLNFGFSGDGGPATSALLSNIGLAINSTGGLYIADTGNNRVRFVQLAPTSTTSPTKLDFGNQPLGVAGSPTPITLTNTGSDDLLITSIVDANEFSQTNNCPISPNPLAPSQSCTINVTFTPTATGSANDTLTITDNSAGSPHTFPLTAVGAAPFNLTTTCTSLTVVQGQSAIYTVDLAPAQGFTQSVSLACSGAPAGGTCTVNPSSMTLNGSSPIQAKVTATTTPPATGFLRHPLNRSNENRWAGLIGIAGMGGFAAMIIFPGKRGTKPARRLCGWIFCLCLLSTMATLSSCGVGGGASDPSPTPAGMYPLTVTATFKSASGTSFSQNVSFNLVVQ